MTNQRLVFHIIVLVRLPRSFPRNQKHFPLLAFPGILCGDSKIEKYVMPQTIKLMVHRLILGTAFSLHPRFYPTTISISVFFHRNTRLWYGCMDSTLSE